MNRSIRRGQRSGLNDSFNCGWLAWIDQPLPGSWTNRCMETLCQPTWAACAETDRLLITFV